MGKYLIIFLKSVILVAVLLSFKQNSSLRCAFQSFAHCRVNKYEHRV